MRGSTETAASSRRRIPGATDSFLKSPANKSSAVWIPLTALLLPSAVAATLAVAIALHWPYSERMLVPTLQATFKTNVRMQKFRRFYFPHPGCEAETVTLTRMQGGPAVAPLATAQKLTITGRYADLIFRPHHIAEIRLDGLHVQIPPREKAKGLEQPELSNESLPNKISIGTVTADESVLEFDRDDAEEPLRFEIQRLGVSPIAARQAMNYQVKMKIPEPPGELESQGTLGPLQAGQIGRIPLAGNARLTEAKLDKYPGIGGTVSSTEKFTGTLEQVQVSGEAAVPDFHLKRLGHVIAVTSQFQVIANGLKGEARLRDVTGKIGKTVVRAQGEVAKNADLGRRDTRLDFWIGPGRVEDLLWLFNSANKPPMLGVATGSGHIEVPKFGKGFLSSLVADGRFEVREAHFQRETQVKVNELSARAQGKKVDDPNEAREVTVTRLSSEVTIEKAVAHLARLYFEVPGARARLVGTYNLESHQVDLHGNLWTDATVSKDTTGIKSMLLKPVDPLFKRKHAGAMVEVEMTGDVDAPHFGTLPTRKKTAWQGKP